MEGQAQWLPTVDEAYDRMIASIQQASRSVRLETYTYAKGGPGDRFREALLRAAARGVRVRVLMDAWGSQDLPRHYWVGLNSSGGEARWFNPIAFSRLAFRNHRKLLVVDEAEAFIGGFNIAPQYSGDGVTRGWRDLGLRVGGELAEQLAASFDVLFENHDLRHPRLLHFRYSPLRPDLRGTRGDPLIVSGPGLGINRFSQSLLEDLKRANTVRICAAYFVPGYRMRRALMQAAKRGRSVELILAGKSDVPLARLAARALYGPLLKMGVRIYEYEPQVLHAKVALLDDVVYAGSSNLDARSLEINYELMLRLESASLADEGRRIFALDRSRSKEITLRAWRRRGGLWTRLQEGWAHFLLRRIDPWFARRQLRQLT